MLIQGINYSTGSSHPSRCTQKAQDHQLVAEYQSSITKNCRCLFSSAQCWFAMLRSVGSSEEDITSTICRSNHQLAGIWVLLRFLAVLWIHRRYQVCGRRNMWVVGERKAYLDASCLLSLFLFCLGWWTTDLQLWDEELVDSMGMCLHYTTLQYEEPHTNTMNPRPYKYTTIAFDGRTQIDICTFNHKWLAAAIYISIIFNIRCCNSIFVECSTLSIGGCGW